MADSPLRNKNNDSKSGKMSLRLFQYEEQFTKRTAMRLNEKAKEEEQKKRENKRGDFAAPPRYLSM